MKGATADPCVSTIKPPNIKNTKNMGRSQNFFLTFMNFQSSFTKSIMRKSSKLIPEGI